MATKTKSRPVRFIDTLTTVEAAPAAEPTPKKARAKRGSKMNQSVSLIDQIANASQPVDLTVTVTDGKAKFTTLTRSVCNIAGDYAYVSIALHGLYQKGADGNYIAATLDQAKAAEGQFFPERQEELATLAALAAKYGWSPMVTTRVTTTGLTATGKPRLRAPRGTGVKREALPPIAVGDRLTFSANGITYKVEAMEGKRPTKLIDGNGNVYPKAFVRKYWTGPL